jgi:hypothetical protein
LGSALFSETQASCWGNSTSNTWCLSFKVWPSLIMRFLIPLCEITGNCDVTAFYAAVSLDQPFRQGFLPDPTIVCQIAGSSESITKYGVNGCDRAPVLSFQA